MSVSSTSELDPHRGLTWRRRRGAEASESAVALRSLDVTARWLRGRIIKRLTSLDLRGVELADAAGVHAFGPIEKVHDSNGEGDRAARIEVLDPRFYRSVACGGSLGFGRAYVDGEWTTPDLSTLLQRLARATVGNARVEGPATWPARIARTIRRLGRRNTRRGSRRHIHAHYAENLFTDIEENDHDAQTHEHRAQRVDLPRLLPHLQDRGYAAHDVAHGEEDQEGFADLCQVQAG